MGALTDGARLLAEGDLGHKIRVAGGRDHAALAESFNAMSDRLAETFHLLEHDREQLRAILSGMVEGVIAVDEARGILFANDRAGRLLGFDPAEAVGRSLWDTVTRSEFRTIVEKGLTGTDPLREEFDWPGPPARILAVYVSRFPGHGAPGAVVVVHDVSDVRQAERMRQDFVANVSHELKTPLAVIKSNVEALTDGRWTTRSPAGRSSARWCRNPTGSKNSSRTC